jgi:phosphoribosyl-ATP pyrophosphohydrolase
MKITFEIEDFKKVLHATSGNIKDFVTNEDRWISEMANNYNGVINKTKMNNNTFEELQANVYKWAEDKDLLKEENALKQLEKVKEEVAEIEVEILSDNTPNLRLELGDGLVTLIILAYQKGLHPVDCLRAAWNKIEHRKGRTIQGTFVKESDLPV